MGAASDLLFVLFVLFVFGRHSPACARLLGFRTSTVECRARDHPRARMDFPLWREFAVDSPPTSARRPAALSWPGAALKHSVRLGLKEGGGEGGREKRKQQEDRKLRSPRPVTSLWHWFSS